MTITDPAFAVIQAHRDRRVLDAAGEGPFEQSDADVLAWYAIVEWAGLEKLAATSPSTPAGHSEMAGYIDEIEARHGRRYRASGFYHAPMDRRADSAAALKHRRGLFQTESLGPMLDQNVVGSSQTGWYRSIRLSAKAGQICQ